MAGAAVQLAQLVAMQDGILAVIQEYLQQREGLLQFHQRGPHLREHDEAVQADAQLPFLPLAPCGGQVLQPLQARDDVQGVKVELSPQVGQHRTAARAAPEQGRVQILLEMPDDLLHGRAAHAQTASGGREGAGLGHGPKIVQAFRGDDHVCLPQTGHSGLGAEGRSHAAARALRRSRRCPCRILYRAGPLPDAGQPVPSGVRPFPVHSMCRHSGQLEQGHARDDERDARKPQRLHGVAEKQGPGQKGTGRAYACPDGVGRPDGDVLLGHEEQGAADEHADARHDESGQTPQARLRPFEAQRPAYLAQSCQYQEQPCVHPASSFHVNVVLMVRVPEGTIPPL